MQEISNVVLYLQDVDEALPVDTKEAAEKRRFDSIADYRGFSGSILIMYYSGIYLKLLLNTLFTFL